MCQSKHIIIKNVGVGVMVTSCMHVDIMLHRAMRPVAVSPGACDIMPCHVRIPARDQRHLCNG